MSCCKNCAPELKENETAPLEGKQLEERDFLQDNKICEMIIKKAGNLLVNIRVKNEKTQAIDHKFLLTETDDMLKDKKQRQRVKRCRNGTRTNGWSTQKERNSKVSRARMMWIVFWLSFSIS